MEEVTHISSERVSNGSFFSQNIFTADRHRAISNTVLSNMNVVGITFSALSR